MDDCTKERIKKLVVYSSCSISMVSIYGIGVNISRESPYHTSIFLTSTILSICVPCLIKRIFINDNDDSEM